MCECKFRWFRWFAVVLSSWLSGGAGGVDCWELVENDSEDNEVVGS